MKKTFIGITLFLIIDIAINAIDIVSFAEAFSDAFSYVPIILSTLNEVPEIMLGLFILLAAIFTGILFYIQKKGWEIFKIVGLVVYAGVAFCLMCMVAVGFASDVG